MGTGARGAYWGEAVEFLGYFILMTGLGAAMFVLVSYAPQANATWYINTCLLVAAMTGGYAIRMYRRYRATRRTLTTASNMVHVTASHISPDERRRRNWADRISSVKLRETSPERVKLLSHLEAVEEAYRARCRARGEEPDPSSFEMSSSMTTEDIRKRIALRLDQ